MSHEYKNTNTDLKYWEFIINIFINLEHYLKIYKMNEI